ncbi:DnaK suppressor protein [Pseudonocardia sediminis]|uniref:DnaK suppressor protein n=1 Tax=Pseudonocardia sediminis TaxID=1397368 RepID=A0A4Q7V7H6_PSEST|nr:TraR/DksA C4-type zinc finger protein [Pseudonocardia sediminis]RZT88763.1 DnaK suppressor protein [Pseudonocardia sediminis]
MEQTRLRSLLQDELDRLDTESSAEDALRPDRSDADRGAEGTDFGDNGSRATESMDDELMIGTIRRQRAQVAAALERVDSGTFGRCAVCDREIDDERLEARPETDRCREHPEDAASIGSVEH